MVKKWLRSDDGGTGVVAEEKRMLENRYDVVIVGAGPAGAAAARRSADTASKRHHREGQAAAIQDVQRHPVPERLQADRRRLRPAPGACALRACPRARQSGLPHAGESRRRRSFQRLRRRSRPRRGRSQREVVRSWTTGSAGRAESPSSTTACSGASARMETIWSSSSVGAGRTSRSERDIWSARTVRDPPFAVRSRAASSRHSA